MVLEKSVVLINRLLEPYELRIKLQFVEDYVDDEGELHGLSALFQTIYLLVGEEHGKV